jgi:hypothetical protein
MTEDQILNLLREARADGERYGFTLAIGVVRAYLAALNDPDVSKAYPHDQLFARRDQLEKVLKVMVERGMKL